MKRMYNKNVAKIFIISLILIGVIFGLLYFNLQSDLNKSVILSKMDSLSTVISKQHQNLIFTHLITIIILVFLAYSIIGVPLVFFYLFYESTSIGFLIASFYSAFKVKGLLFSLIYKYFWERSGMWSESENNGIVHSYSVLRQKMPVL